MKAVVYRKYGTPDELKLEEIKKSVPKPNEVLIKVLAASINSWDLDWLQGKPNLITLWRLLKPKYPVLGADIAGVVEATGENVRHLSPGDEVFGDLCQDNWGGFAEYVCARENTLTLKPRGITFEQAAAIPQAGVMALQAIRDKGKVKTRQTVLVNGGGGGVGTFAIQLAKLEGAEVTAVDSASKLELLHSLGADYVIDYKKVDFTKTGKPWDLIVDPVASHSLIEYRKVLNPGGVFVLIGGTSSIIVETLFFGSFYTLAGKLFSAEKNKKLGILTHQPNKNLTTIVKLVESGKIKSVIDKTFPLEKTSDAFYYYTTGQVQGKIIITV